VPVLATGAPWQPWFLGQQGNPGDPASWWTFDDAFHDFRDLGDVIAVVITMGNRTGTGRHVGGRIPNDGGGLAAPDFPDGGGCDRGAERDLALHEPRARLPGDLGRSGDGKSLVAENAGLPFEGRMGGGRWPSPAAPTCRGMSRIACPSRPGCRAPGDADRRGIQGVFGIDVVGLVRPQNRWPIVRGCDINRPPPEVTPESASGVAGQLVGVPGFETARRSADSGTGNGGFATATVTDGQPRPAVEKDAECRGAPTTRPGVRTHVRVSDTAATAGAPPRQGRRRRSGRGGEPPSSSRPDGGRGGACVNAAPARRRRARRGGRPPAGRRW
jgi:hypothetical protein